MFLISAHSRPCVAYAKNQYIDCVYSRHGKCKWVNTCQDSSRTSPRPSVTIMGEINWLHKVLGVNTQPKTAKGILVNTESSIETGVLVGKGKGRNR